MEAQMTLWTAGERVYDNGKAKPGPGFLKRLKAPPPEIWEIRVTAPVSQARIFGRFAEPDTFIATDMWTRQALGKAKSSTWSKAMKQCETDWNKLFPGSLPFSGAKMSDYVTENCDDFTL